MRANPEGPMIIAIALFITSPDNNLIAVAMKLSTDVLARFKPKPLVTDYIL